MEYKMQSTVRVITLNPKFSLESDPDLFLVCDKNGSYPCATRLVEDKFYRVLTCMTMGVKFGFVPKHLNKKVNTFPKDLELLNRAYGGVFDSLIEYQTGEAINDFKKIDLRIQMLKSCAFYNSVTPICNQNNA